MYRISSHAIYCLIAAITTLAMGTFIVTKNKKSPVNASFFLLAFSSFIWQLGNFFILMSTKQNLALFWVKFAFIGIALIPVTTYQLTIYFLKIRQKNFIIVLSYLTIVILVIPLSWTKYFFSYAALFSHLQRRVQSDKRLSSY